MNVFTHTLIFFFLFQTPGRVGSQGSDLDSSATPIDVNNESSSEVWKYNREKDSLLFKGKLANTYSND